MEMKIRDRKRGWKTVLLAAVIVLVLVIAFGLYRYYCIKENVTLIEDELNGALTYAPDHRAEDFAYMEELLERPFLNDNQKGIIYERMAALYQIENDALNYYKYLGYALYYLELSGNAMKEVNLYGDLVKYFVENNSYNLAEGMLRTTLDIIPLEEYTDMQMKGFVQRLQGIVAGYQGRPEEAVEYLEQSAQTSRTELALVNEQLGEKYAAMADLQRALVYLREGDAVSAGKIVEQYGLEEIPEGQDYLQFVISDYQMPYLECRIRMAVLEHDPQAVKENLEMYQGYCRDYGYEKRMLDMLLLYTESFDIAEDPASVEIYRQINQAYLAITDMQENEYNELLARQLSNSISELEHQRESEKRRKMEISVILIIAAVLLLLAWLLHYAMGRAVKDGLTGVMNRRGLDKELGRIRSRGQKVSAVMFDIDDFKKVNDTYGHETGDYVLRELGSILKGYESSMIKVYRYGGEEFVMLVKSSDIMSVVEIAETLRFNIQHHDWKDGMKITVSVGVAHNEATEPMISVADENLYYVKQNGKNAVAYCEGTERKLFGQ